MQNDFAKLEYRNRNKTYTYVANIDKRHVCNAGDMPDIKFQKGAGTPQYHNAKHL
jgi:hypothetical protein